MRFLGLVLSSIAAMTLAERASFGGTILLADFDNSATGRIDAQAPDTPADVLDDGTTGGSWTVTDDQESEIGVDTNDATNKALAGDRGPYDMEVTLDSPVMLNSNLVDFSFDSQILRTLNSADVKKQFVIGWDNSATAKKVFEIVITTDASGDGRLAYIDSGVPELDTQVR